MKIGIEKRFWAKVNKKGPYNKRLRSRCWVWEGSTRNGYGRIYFEGATVPAHRKVWEIKVGKIPEGKQVLHRCDNKVCVNIKHLFVGTQSDNMLDCSRKGRLHKAFGESNYNTKLTNEDVIEIRRRAADGVKQVRLAEEYGLDPANISRIVQRKQWSHIP